MLSFLSKRTVASIVKHNHVRHFSVTSAKKDIFKIQDEDDFKDKVLKSKEPVVVDFFAT